MTIHNIELIQSLNLQILDIEGPVLQGPSTTTDATSHRLRTGALETAGPGHQNLAEEGTGEAIL